MPTPRLKVLSAKRDDGYVPSYEIDGADLGERQRESVAAVADIPGWLRSQDILKLYELAYFARGPILEIGCYHGKSTVVIARALADRERAVPFFSVDLDPVAVRAASRTVGERRLSERVVFMRGSVRACLRAAPALRPALVFVDGDHSRAGVGRDLAALRDRVPDSGIVLFHDYADPRNADPAEPELGVVQAVEESWVARDCDFGGVFGCCALFVRRRGAPVLDPPAAQLLDLAALDSWRMRYVHALRMPLGRRIRAAEARLRAVLSSSADDRRREARG